MFGRQLAVTWLSNWYRETLLGGLCVEDFKALHHNIKNQNQKLVHRSYKSVDKVIDRLCDSVI